jgi:acyl-CoA synthetase (AMP-forming)/AMP-acid ligase II
MGKAIPETEIFVLDGDGKECAPGQVGQLVHAGPTVAVGYWNQPEATAAVFRPHPHRPGERAVYSGDLVKRDDEGFLHFVGRGDQQIKSYGFRISPEEVEAALYRSELLAEVVVRGVPDEVAGQAVEAHVIPRDPASFTEQALQDFCRDALPRYMLPKHIVIHESFPRTASGKLDRKNVK